MRELGFNQLLSSFNHIIELCRSGNYSNRRNFDDIMKIGGFSYTMSLIIGLDILRFQITHTRVHYGL